MPHGPRIVRTIIFAARSEERRRGHDRRSRESFQGATEVASVDIEVGADVLERVQPLPIS
jgi:hypothetical protein